VSSSIEMQNTGLATKLLTCFCHHFPLPSVLYVCTLLRLSPDDLSPFSTSLIGVGPFDGGAITAEEFFLLFLCSSASLIMSRRVLLRSASLFKKWNSAIGRGRTLLVLFKQKCLLG